ncbi:MAG: lytic transglycosylase domain-containing protein [Clostridia bacterium]|nr:lytic transglycosylase domain-containing protein [Clostridia bacterium]
MNDKYRRPLAILIILALALIVGLGADMAWRLIDRSVYPQEYSEIVSKYAAEYNVPEDVIYATIKVESNFDPEAISVAGARGLMQMLPSTFEWLTGEEHLSEHLTPNLLFDPEVNIRYGTYYLKYLYTKFDYNWNTASAAYNGGEGNVAKWLSDKNYSDGEGNLVSFPKEFGETKNYVKKIRHSRDMYLKLYY